MRKFLIGALSFLMLLSCNQSTEKEKTQNLVHVEYKQITHIDYELELPNIKPEAVLVLFGGFPQTANDIKREFKILEKAKENKLAIMYSNFNQKLWLEENELKALAQQIEKIFADNSLLKQGIYIGGFSSGGNVAMLVGDYLTANEKYELAPKGIFIVDSPIDLAALYLTSEKNLERKFSQTSVEESSFLIEMLGAQLGNPADSLHNYERKAVFTSETENINNVKNLKDTKIRLYTEPDTTWWKANRMADYEQMNAYYIKQLYGEMNEQGFSKVEYIPTKDRGYRANGDRHPHSWAIVEPDDLINWMLKE